MNDIHAKIRKLNQTITELQTYFIQTEQIIKDLESKNSSQIISKEKELEAWRNKLEACQQERNQIRKEMKEKRIELEQSQLSNSEKQAKINQLLTEHNEELEEVDKLLCDERTHYRQIRDKLIGKLCEPCQGCQTKEQSIQQKSRIITYLSAIIGTMLILFFLFHVWFMNLKFNLYGRSKRNRTSPR